MDSEVLIRMRGVGDNDVDSDAPRIGDSGISSKEDEGGLSVVGEGVAIDKVDNFGEGREDDWIWMGISNPSPAMEERGEEDGFGGVARDTGAILAARVRSASATFSAVRCGTAGIGLVGVETFPKVMILGCARTATGTGAAAIIAVERYAVVATEARV